MARVFVDASVIFAAGYSPTGAARALFQLSLDGKVTLVVSDFVREEARRNIEKKAPLKLPDYATFLSTISFETVEEPTKEELLEVATYTELKDAPVVAAAKKAQAEYLVTFDRKHLIEPAQVAEKSGLRIVTPDVVLAELKD